MGCCSLLTLNILKSKKICKIHLFGFILFDIGCYYGLKDSFKK